MSKKKYEQLIKDNAEISRMLYEKGEDIEIKRLEMELLEGQLVHWHEKLRKKEATYDVQKRRLIIYEANLKIRNAKKKPSKNSTKQV